MNTPDPILDLLADVPPVVPPANLGPRARQRAGVLRRRHRLLAGTGVLALAVTGTLTATALSGGGAQVLQPAPAATAPPEPAPAGPERPGLDVPPCARVEGVGLRAVPGATRPPEVPVTSVGEDSDRAYGYLPEVEQAVVDTAPTGFRLDCASDSRMILLPPDTDEVYAELDYGLANPLRNAGTRAHFARPDPGLVNLTTPAGALVRLEDGESTHALAEIATDRYLVTLTARGSSYGTAGVPADTMRDWIDRLGDRLIAEARDRPPVTVDLIDRTPNPPPQDYLNRLLAAAPGPATVLPYDPAGRSLAGVDVVSTGPVVPGISSRALAFVTSTTRPDQAAALDRETLDRLEATVEGPEQGWPDGVLVGVIDRGLPQGGPNDQGYYMLLIQDGAVQLNLTTEDRSFVSEDQLRSWAKATIRPR